ASAVWARPADRCAGPRRRAPCTPPPSRPCRAAGGSRTFRIAAEEWSRTHLVEDLAPLRLGPERGEVGVFLHQLAFGIVVERGQAQVAESQLLVLLERIDAGHVVEGVAEARVGLERTLVPGEGFVEI